MKKPTYYVRGQESTGNVWVYEYVYTQFALPDEAAAAFARTHRQCRNIEVYALVGNFRSTASVERVVR